MRVERAQQAAAIIRAGREMGLPGGALVVVPKNLKTAARIVRSAHEKGVPVLAYDRLILNCDLDMYVTFDNEQVGYLQARGVLASVPEGKEMLEFMEPPLETRTLHLIFGKLIRPGVLIVSVSKSKWRSGLTSH